jgi:hypothetical protein
MSTSITLRQDPEGALRVNVIAPHYVGADTVATIASEIADDYAANVLGRPQGAFILMRGSTRNGDQTEYFLAEEV